MRTTIEITEKQRGELLKLSSARGEKGFSSVVRDAIDLYLETHASRRDAVKAALGVRGVLEGEEGDALKSDVEAIRRNWR